MNVNAVKETPTKQSTLTLDDRKKLSLTGVEKVVSAAAAEVILETCAGRLIVCGGNLAIAKYDEASGALALIGDVDALKYAAKKQPLLKKIFK